MKNLSQKGRSGIWPLLLHETSDYRGKLTRHDNIGIFGGFNHRNASRLVARVFGQIRSVVNMLSSPVCPGGPEENQIHFLRF